ncbi:hypothetical protein HZA43_00830 [Candidatus Peregrinibacteria bacterium]|nr:hypothetical protein [Candidatus Peregrinibacteria bacterium]
MSRKHLLLIGFTAMLLLGLNGCGQSNDPKQHPLLGAVYEQLTVKRDVELFASAERKDKDVVVTITLHNLSQKPITSVQSWLSYDPKQLKAKTIKVDNSAFTLTAPYENQFDNDKGLVRLGRANNKPISDVRIMVAQVTFERLTNQIAMLNFYDYQTSLTGHTSVNMLVNNVPYNVLKEPINPAVVIR